MRLSPASRLVLACVVLAAIVLFVAIARPSPPPSSTQGSPLPSASGEPSTQPAADGAGSGDTVASPTAAPSSPDATDLVPSVEPATGAPATSPSSGAGGLALAALLAELPVAPEDRTGYLRTLFPHWIDADGDGCDTRREVLIAESLTPVTVGASCSLSGGTWVSLYDGVRTTDPSTFDIDHLVPLAEAWDSGASAWTTERRTRYANDLDVTWALIAVSASSNRSKGDQDPSTWLPPLASARCEYVSMWLAVKVRWRLSVDPAEESALGADIVGCPERLDVPIAP